MMASHYTISVTTAGGNSIPVKVLYKIPSRPNLDHPSATQALKQPSPINPINPMIGPPSQPQDVLGIFNPLGLPPDRAIRASQANTRDCGLHLENSR